MVNLLFAHDLRALLTPCAAGEVPAAGIPWFVAPFGRHVAYGANPTNSFTVTWQVPALVGEVLMALAAVVWALLLPLFILKWIFAREEAVAEDRLAAAALEAELKRYRGVVSVAEARLAYGH